MMFRDNGDYTYHHFEHDTVINESAKQSLFSGACFFHYAVKDVDFSRCDFEGVDFSNSIFENVNFSSADLRSNRFARCTFNSCSFSKSYWVNNRLNDCTFNNCSLSESTITNTQFNSCTFCACQTKISTITFNIFTKGAFSNIVLGDCSFYKNILDACSFSECSINVDSLGQTYGLSLADTQKFAYIFLGKEYGCMNSVLYENLDKIYQAKNWNFERALLMRSFEKINTYELITTISGVLFSQIQQKRLVKEDDILFYRQIVDYLKDTNCLPLFALLQAIRTLSDALLLETISCYSGVQKSIENCTFHFAQLAQELLSKFDDANDYTGNPNEAIKLSLHYDHDRLVDYAGILNQWMSQAAGLTSNPAKLIGVRNGSIWEILATTIICVYSLQFIIYGINGVLIQLIDLRASVSILTRKTSPKAYVERIISGKQTRPEFCRAFMKLLQDKNFTSVLSETIKKLSGVRYLSGDISESADETSSET